MTVSLAEPPADVRQLTQDTLQQIAGRRDFRVRPLAAAEPEQIRIASGHPVYNVGLTDLVDGRPLARLSRTSWRFLVHDGTATTTAAETVGGGTDGDARFASVNDGPFVEGTADAFAAVEKDAAYAGGDWEIRLLRVPALFVLAVWTHERTTGEDRVRPVDPVPEGLDATRTYDWDSFVAVLKPRAQAKLAHDEPRRG